MIIIAFNKLKIRNLLDEKEVAWIILAFSGILSASLVDDAMKAGLKPIPMEKDQVIKAYRQS